MTVDILYLAWNRREFTEFTFGQLLANTDWERVQRLVVYDDTSEDGTAEFLADAINRSAVPAELRIVDLKSPPAVMNHYVTRSDAEFFAKIDNDIVVPPGWLEAMMGVHEDVPGIELLGMESGRMGKPWDGCTYGFEEGSHTGGVGVFRTSAFAKRPPMEERAGRFGFTEWQRIYRPVRGWITPDLLLTSLDQIPFEPWRSLSEQYIENGWQRRWHTYDEVHNATYWEWWP